MTDVAIMTKEDYTNLMHRLDSLEGLLKVMAKNTKTSTIVNVADVAQLEGISVTNLKEKKPWLMPNFGVSEFQGSRRWKYETYEAWTKIPETTRIERFREWKLNG